MFFEESLWQTLGIVLCMKRKKFEVDIHGFVSSGKWLATFVRALDTPWIG